MSIVRFFGFTVLACGMVVGASAIALGQTASAVQTAHAPVLVPYGEPGNTDPHADAITQTLSADLTAAGIAFNTIAPTVHLDAVANAAKICAQTGATALLVPDGRYEQTEKTVALPFFITLMKYPAHVELRLDEVGCDGTVRWSTVETGDQSISGVDSVGNVGSAIDAAYRVAALEVVHDYAAVNQSALPISPVAAPNPGVPTPGPTSTVLLVPFEQPKVADPHAPDMTHSLLLQMQQRKINVTLGTPIDHLTAVADAATLCAANGAQEIVVADIRVEQSTYTGRSHAALRLTLLGCNGAILGHGDGDADTGQAFIRNFGASMVGVSERAMIPALDELFPSTKTAP